MGGIPEIESLTTEYKTPVLGFGTAVAFPLPAPEVLESSIIDAIEVGYRHFDTAGVYGTEGALGRAISEALRRGLISSREELFITSKFWSTDASHELVIPAIHQTLETLGLEYLDLYLIHWPMPDKLKREFDMVYNWFSRYKSTWEGMEECQRLGLARSIGVCDFSLEEIASHSVHCKIAPSVNQVEMHPYWQQRKLNDFWELKDFCENRFIRVSAYSPLGNMIPDSKEIEEIAEAIGKSTTQVCLRWAFQQGVSFIQNSLSFDKAEMKENIDIFQWNLDEHHLQKIREIGQQKTSTDD